MVACLTCVLSLATGDSLVAHEEPHAQIERLSREIELHPDDVDLYLARAGLHRLGGHWEEALDDLERVAELDPAHPTIDFHRGRVLFEAGRPGEARRYLDCFLSENPNHVGALIARARALKQIGQAWSAAEDYTWALAHLASPTPVFFLERADALADSGDDQLGLAIASLEDGIERLGPLVVLQVRAIELEVRAGRYDDALARVDGILSRMTRSERKERWFARRGEILEEAGRLVEARASYAEALAAIDQLPGRHGQTPAAQELAADLSRRLMSYRSHAQERRGASPLEERPR